jgi:hypothetical protein
MLLLISHQQSAKTTAKRGEKIEKELTKQINNVYKFVKG